MSYGGKMGHAMILGFVPKQMKLWPHHLMLSLTPLHSVSHLQHERAGLFTAASSNLKIWLWVARSSIWVMPQVSKSIGWNRARFTGRHYCLLRPKTVGELSKHSNVPELFPVEEGERAQLSRDQLSASVLVESTCSGSTKHKTTDTQTRLSCHQYSCVAGGCHLSSLALSLLFFPLQALKAQFSCPVSFIA